MYIAAAQGETTPGDKILMSAEKKSDLVMVGFRQKIVKGLEDPLLLMKGLWC